MEAELINALTEAVLGRLFVEIEASGRHVHVTRDQALALFGHDLTPQRPLSQPGQFLARERVTVMGPRGRLERVAVLGPARKEAQVELSLTDAKALGLEIPVRLSGDVSGTPGAVLEGPKGSVHLAQGVIAARRHIHLRPQDAAAFGVQDRQVVHLQTFTQRPLCFGDVVVRVSKDFMPYVHLDYDEANACGFTPGDFGRIEP